MEEKRRGEDGYNDWSMALHEMNLCSCDGCGGHLEDGTCISCGCYHFVQEPSAYGISWRGPAWIPNIDGRCAHALAVREAELREQERTRRRHWAAGE